MPLDVRTASGVLRGVDERGVLAFRGIPYATLPHGLDLPAPRRPQPDRGGHRGRADRTPHPRPARRGPGVESPV